MRLFLIRHGETVDNVKGVYAGITDSPLTNHGVLQARRLGQHFASHSIIPFRIFSSDLKRAVKTAEAISESTSTSIPNATTPSTNGMSSSEPRFLPKTMVSANGAISNNHNDFIDAEEARQGMGGRRRLKVIQCPGIREQDFGYYEGKPFYARPNPKSKLSGKDAHRIAHRVEPGFVDVESRLSMDARCNTFVDTHVVPLLAPFELPPQTKWKRSKEEMEESVGEKNNEKEESVIVVAHGIILGHLWRSILRRVERCNIVLGQGIMLENERGVEHLGGWGNTGYLELEIFKQSDGSVEIPPELETVAAQKLADDVERKNAETLPAGDVEECQKSLADEKTPKRKLGDLRKLGSTTPPELSQSQNPTAGDAESTMPPEIDVDDEDSADKPSSTCVPSPRMSGGISSKAASAKQHVLPGVHIKIVAINSLVHLQGLKKTKGGIGSAKFDEGQKTIESFFKKVRTE